MQLIAFACAVCLIFSVASVAAVSTCDPNGLKHCYEYVQSSGISFAAASAAAQASTSGGQRGYLATITSAAENAFIQSVVAGSGQNFLINNNIYFGGSDSLNEGVWRWNAGPEKDVVFWQGANNGSPVGGAYNNWRTNEPFASNGADEDYTALWPTFSYKWNDQFPSSAQMTGYVVEYDTPLSGSAVCNTYTVQALMGAPGLATLSVTAGDFVQISADPNDQWSTSPAGGNTNNADGLPLQNDGWTFAQGYPIAAQLTASASKTSYGQNPLVCRAYSLIGNIGNGPYFCVGSDFEATVTETGVIHLVQMDGGFGNNSGSLEVRVCVTKPACAACQASLKAKACASIGQAVGC